MVHHVESTVGITVLFDENLTEEEILALGALPRLVPQDILRDLTFILESVMADAM